MPAWLESTWDEDMNESDSCHRFKLVTNRYEYNHLSTLTAANFITSIKTTGNTITSQDVTSKGRPMLQARALHIHHDTVFSYRMCPPDYLHTYIHTYKYQPKFAVNDLHLYSGSLFLGIHECMSFV